ncbi:P68 family surface lipoprotein [Mycoplasmopsis agalactiae]|uniref:Mycoplasma lipoprotein C-terminal domain-containing protein n=1 Tax=Mycoplasmopsis agalactiae TaxID=2110 RepID=D3VRK4_MYCAA|nr:hypothetical protein [Mycoplasmopsis agalactiae]KAB6718389.1 glycerol ABC transporter substrate-binding protein [Mycoplasmopsis agalactiae]CBH40952.1 Conserved hypothetical protein, predictedlipoprotein [Mycoplasmopsis agalactiae]
MKKILIKAGAILLPAAAGLSVVACGNTDEEKVVFRLGQGKGWPLSLSLQKIIGYYNETFKNDPDFLTIRFEFADDFKYKDSKGKEVKVPGHNTYSEYQLIKNVAHAIESKDNKKVPNIVLGDQSGAYILNQNKQLLDISDTGITKKSFSKNIANLHSILAGQGQTETIYNIPFDNADTDSLQLNLKVLLKMFEIIKSGGGKIEDENVDGIIKKVYDSKDKGNKLPEQSIWHALKAKNGENSKKVFDGLTVSNKTFTSIKDIRYLAAKFTDGVEIEKGKINDNTISGEVLSIDYQQSTFFKELHAKIEDKNKAIFELDKDKNVKYNLIDDADVKNKFKELWEDYNKSIKRVEQTPSGKDDKDKKVFQSMKYMFTQTKEWGSWQIFRFQSAISFAASVGAYQNKITQFTKTHPYFEQSIKDDPKFLTNNASEHDVLMLPQVTGTKDGKHKIFHEGGSSIIAIDSKNEKVNKAIKKFLKWIYTGKNKVSGEEEENWYTIARTSGYIMPLASVVTSATNDKIKGIIKELEGKLKDKKSEELMTTFEPDYFKLNMLRSAQLSLESLLNVENGNVVAKPAVTDDKSSQMSNTVLQAMIEQTELDRNKEFKAKTAEELITAFEQTKKQ